MKGIRCIAVLLITALMVQTMQLPDMLSFTSYAAEDGQEEGQQETSSVTGDTGETTEQPAGEIPEQPSDGPAEGASDPAAPQPGSEPRTGATDSQPAESGVPGSTGTADEIITPGPTDFLTADPNNAEIPVNMETAGVEQSSPALDAGEGTCGENLIWKLEEGVLTISGNGPMDDYHTEYDSAGRLLSSSRPAPWSKYADQIHTLVLEDGVTSIGQMAFQSLKIKNLVIPGTVTRIGGEAFQYCYDLEHVTIPGSVTSIGNTGDDSMNGFSWKNREVFYGCRKLKTAGPVGGGYDIEFGWTQRIPENVFYGTTIESVVIPDGIAYIGESAFRDCTGLTEIVLPEGVTEIGSWAFAGCSNLEKINIPGSVTTIQHVGGAGYQSDLFLGCNKLKTVGPVGGGYHIEIGWTEEIPAYAFTNAGGIEEVIIPSGVTKIWQGAFTGNRNLSHIVIPASVVEFPSVGSSTQAYINGSWKLQTAGPVGGGYDIEFGYTEHIPARFMYMVNSLKNITIPDGVTSIGNRAFYGCQNVETVHLPDSLTSIGSSAIDGESIKETLVIPAGVTSCYGAFQNFDTIGPVGGGYDLEYQWTQEIPSGAFSMTYASYIRIGATVTKLGGANVQSGKLKTVGPAGGGYDIEIEWTESIPEGAFSGSYIESVVLPESITSIGNTAFNTCQNLRSINMPRSLREIGQQAFGYCNRLTSSIALPYGLQSIGNSAFYKCEGIKSVTLPNSLQTIGNSAFYGCTSLSTVRIPKSVETIPSYAFAGCTGLKSVQLCEGLKSIREWAFLNCTSLHSLALPAGLTSMSMSAFSKTALSTLTIPSTVERFFVGSWSSMESGYSTGLDLSSFTDVYFEEGTQYIQEDFLGANAYFNASVQKAPAALHIPESVTAVCDNAIKNCVGNGLTDIYYGGSPSQWENVDIYSDNDNLDEVMIHYGNIDEGITPPSMYLSVGKSKTLSVNQRTNVGTIITLENEELTWVSEHPEVAAVDQGIVTALAAGKTKITASKEGVTYSCVVSVLGVGSAGNGFRTEIPYWDDGTQYLNVYWGNGGMFGGSARVYHRQIATLAAGLSAAAEGTDYNYTDGTHIIWSYRNLEIEDKNIFLFSYPSAGSFNQSQARNSKNKKYADDEDLAFSIAHKPVVIKEKEVNLVIVTARGSKTNWEFIMDRQTGSRKDSRTGYDVFDVVDDFANDMWSGLEYYFEKHKELYEKPVAFLVTGHSLGGAAANLLGAWLTTERHGTWAKNIDVKNDLIHVYTFGGINSLSGYHAPVESGYENIHNVFNFYDTYGPLNKDAIFRTAHGAGTGIGKFGHVDWFYKDYGSEGSINHNMPGYISAVRGGWVGHDLSPTKRMMVACPVDVEIYDGSALIGRVTDNVVDEEVTVIPMFVHDDVKYIWLENGCSYQIRATATGQGKMNVLVEDIGEGDSNSVITFENITLETGKEMISVIDTERPAEETRLYVLDGNGEVDKEIDTDGSEHEALVNIPDPTREYPDAIWMTGISDLTYTGKAQTQPALRVLFGRKTLTLNKDYVVKYKNNVKAGTASVTVTGKGNFAGTVTETFTIRPKDIGTVNMTAPDVVYQAKGGIYKSTPMLIDPENNKKLAAKTDYYEAGNKTYPFRYTYVNDTNVQKVQGKTLVDDGVRTAGSGVQATDVIPVGTEIKVTVTGKGNYTGEADTTFRITSPALSKATVSVKKKYYNGGREVKLLPEDITVISGGIPLIYGIDYRIVEDSYINHTKKGTAKVTLEGIGDCIGRKTISFTIAAYNIGTDASLDASEQRMAVTFLSPDGTDKEGAPAYKYVKGGVKPQVAVTYRSVSGETITLKEKTDYTVSYANNGKTGDSWSKNSRGASTASAVTITGKGAYSGKISKSFSITPKDLSEVMLTAPDVVYQAKGGIYKPAPVLTDPANGKKLAVKTDYYEAGNKINPITYTYVNATTVQKVQGRTLVDNGTREAGSIVEAADVIPVGTEIRVTVTGKGNYAGENSTVFRVRKADISKAKVAVKTQVYDGGKEINPAPSDFTVKLGNLTLAHDVDYRIVEDSYVNHTKKGTAKVILEGIGDCIGRKTVSFTIAAYNIGTDASLDASEQRMAVTFLSPDGTDTEGAPAYKYVKGSVKPQVAVTYRSVSGETITLKEKTDYTVSYANNGKTGDSWSKNSRGASTAPSVIVTGKGAYSGKISKTFSITQKDLSEVQISAPDIVYQAKGGIYKSAPVLKDTNGAKLVVKTDYYEAGHKTDGILYTYVHNTNVKTVQGGKLVDNGMREAGSVVQATDVIPVGTEICVTVKGKENYTGEKSTSFRIIKGDIAKAKVTIPTQFYTGKEVRLSQGAITVKIGSTTLGTSDYRIAGYANNVHQGTAKLTIEGTGEYSGTKTVTFKIAPRSVNYSVTYRVDREQVLAALQQKHNLTSEEAAKRFVFSGSMAVSSTAPGGKLSANKFKVYDTVTKKYLTFAGWTMRPDGTGTVYGNQAVFRMTWLEQMIYGTRVTLYAQWK